MSVILLPIGRYIIYFVDAGENFYGDKQSLMIFNFCQGFGLIFYLIEALYGAIR